MSDELIKPRTPEGRRAYVSGYAAAIDILERSGKTVAVEWLREMAELEMPQHKTMGQARREAGIPESEYIKGDDTLDRVSTIRCLARILGPPDHRWDHPASCSLDWTVERQVHIVVRRNGSITS